MFTILFALICLGAVAFLFELTIALFVAWLVFSAITWVLSLFGLQDYAFLVFVIFLVWSWWRR